MIVVGTTLAPYVMDQVDTWAAWLYNAEQIAESHDVRFFAAIETDVRGIGLFQPLTDRLAELGGEWWEFRFDDGANEINTGNRLRRIVTGQNLVTMYSEETGASHLLFMAADCAPPPDALPKLLDLDWPIVGGEVATYCLSGDSVLNRPGTTIPFDYPVEQHMATAAFILIESNLLRKIRWRYESTGMSDDPCMHHDANQLGYATLVRKDCIGVHYPQAIPAIEDRGHDMKVYR